MHYQKPNLLYYRVAQAVSAVFAACVFKRKLLRNEIKGLKGPFVVIANHQAAYDFVNLIGTCKLLKWLGVDVYMAKTCGTYFAMPKWTCGFRPGKYIEIQDGQTIYRCVLKDGKLAMKFINMVKIFYELKAK